MSASNYLEAAILNHIFDEAEFTAPTWYVALSTTTPDETGNVTEPDDPGVYARQALGATTLTGNSVSNDAEITFPTAETNWGTVTHFALYDADEDGNLLGSGALTASKTVTIGDSVKFAAGALTITLD